MWNIRGLQTIRNRKLQDPTVKEIITNHNILCFVESHTDSESIINMEGYTTIHNPRPKSRHKGKMYGDVVALVRNSLLDGIKEIKPRREGCVWLELQVAYFHLEKNVLIGFLYVEPGITKKADPLKHIRAGLEDWDPTNPLILMGDINARIGDQVSSSATHSFEHVECIPLEEKETHTHLPREMLDKGRNLYGSELLKLANLCNLSVLNGKKVDATSGGFTCFAQPSHPTTIDLSLVSARDRHLILKLEVLQYYPDLSDHCPISITTNIEHGTKEKVGPRLDRGIKVELTKAHWSQEYKDDVANSLATESTKTECTTLLHRLTSSTAGTVIDETIEALNQILFTAMAGNCKVTFSKVPKKRSLTTKPQTKLGMTMNVMPPRGPLGKSITTIARKGERYPRSTMG